VLIISTKCCLKTPCGLGDPSIASWRLYLDFSAVLICTWWTICEVTADRLRGHRGPSTWSQRTVRDFPDSTFLSILFVGGFLVHEVCERFVLECRTVCEEADGPRVHHGQSIILGALLEVWVAISEGMRPPRGQSARTLRTVRLVLSRLPMSFAF
jgi:hypothetical protein